MLFKHNGELLYCPFHPWPLKVFCNSQPRSQPLLLGHANIAKLLRCFMSLLVRKHGSQGLDLSVNLRQPASATGVCLCFMLYRLPSNPVRPCTDLITNTPFNQEMSPSYLPVCGNPNTVSDIHNTKQRKSLCTWFGEFCSCC